MREQELRRRLQTLAEAGQVAPEPAAFGAVRRRARRKLQGAAALVVGLLVAVAGVWVAAEAVRRPGADPTGRAALRPTGRVVRQSPARAGRPTWPRTRSSPPTCAACTCRRPPRVRPRPATPPGPSSTWPPGPGGRPSAA